MVRAARNLGRPGLVSCAISAVDTALSDLKAILLGLPDGRLLGMARSHAGSSARTPSFTPTPSGSGPEYASCAGRLEPLLLFH
jgi:L-alanine-DL-glutamate epimerase-like enolase superfamily enzyme